MVKKLPANAGDKRDIREVSSLPELRRQPGGGNGYALQYSFLENSMDRGARRAIGHGIAKTVGLY